MRLTKIVPQVADWWRIHFLLTLFLPILTPPWTAKRDRDREEEETWNGGECWAKTLESRRSKVWHIIRELAFGMQPSHTHTPRRSFSYPSFLGETVPNVSLDRLLLPISTYTLPLHIGHLDSLPPLFCNVWLWFEGPARSPQKLKEGDNERATNLLTPSPNFQDFLDNNQPEP